MCFLRFSKRKGVDNSDLYYFKDKGSIKSTSKLEALGRHFFTQMTTVIWVKNCRSKKGLKQCLGGLKCSQNTKKNKKTLKVSFKAIFNVHFAYFVSKAYFSIQRLIIFLLYE